MPAISVVMPVYNGCQLGKQRYLEAAVTSIIDQTFTDFEFIIIDDGSTDNTNNCLQDFARRDARIKIFKNPTNQKIVRSLNYGLQLATSHYVARMDSDDISTVTRFEIQKKFLDDRPDTAMAGTGMYVINHEGKLEFEVSHPCHCDHIRQFLKQGCPFVHGSVMFRREAVLSVGGYSTDPNVEYAEDYDLWVRLAAKFKLENIPEKSLYFHRNHGTKSSNTYRGQQEISTRNVIAKASTLL